MTIKYKRKTPEERMLENLMQMAEYRNGKLYIMTLGYMSMAGLGVEYYGHSKYQILDMYGSKVRDTLDKKITVEEARDIFIFAAKKDVYEKLVDAVHAVEEDITPYAAELEKSKEIAVWC